MKHRRHELTDAAWAAIAPLLPPNARRGRAWRDHRAVLNAILRKLSTGTPWRDLPARYQPWRTPAARLLRWQRDGTWARLLRRVQQCSDAVATIDWEVSVDATVLRAHQHAAGAPKKGPAQRSTRRWGAAAGA